MRTIGEAQQQWAPLRRKYNLFAFRDFSQNDTIHQQFPTSKETQTDLRNPQSTGTYDQFAYVDERFLSWDFSLFSSSDKLIGSVNRNFAGFGREIFTDTGVYALRMDAAGLAEEPTHIISKTGASETIYGHSGGMSLDQRAVMLATAVSIDFDYFSRQRSGAFGGIFPFWMGGVPAEGAAGAEGVAGAEAAGSAAAGDATLPESAGGIEKAATTVPGSGEGAMAGAGAVAGYEAMQRGAYGSSDDASPTAGGRDDVGQHPAPQQQHTEGGQEEIWGEQWPWGDDSGRGRSGGSSGGDGGNAGGDGDSGIDVDDWF